MLFHYSHVTGELVINGYRLAWEPGVGTQHCRYIHFPCNVQMYHSYPHWQQHLRMQPVLLLNNVPHEHLQWLTRHTPFHYSYLYNNGKCTLWCMQRELAHALIAALAGGGGWSEGRPVLLQVVPMIFGGSVSSSPRTTYYKGYLPLRPAPPSPAPTLPCCPPILSRKAPPLGRPPLSSKQRRQQRQQRRKQQKSLKKLSPISSSVKSVLVVA